jgi:HSP20 family protein
MALMTWDPLREMDTLHREIDRLFEDMGMGRWSFPFTRFSFLPGRASRMYPLLNMSEDEDHLYIEALAPGIDPKTLKVTVVRNQLTLSGEKMRMAENVKPEAWHRNERAAGTFVRTIALPVEVDEAKTAAEYKNGMLTIKLPKAEAAKPKQITIQVG